MNTIQTYGMTNYGLGFRAQVPKTIGTAPQKLPSGWIPAEKWDQTVFLASKQAREIAKTTLDNKLATHGMPDDSEGLRLFIKGVDRMSKALGNETRDWDKAN